MKRYLILSAIGVVTGMVMLWGVASQSRFGPAGQQARNVPAKPANPCNPCRPSSRRGANPCNPDWQEGTAAAAHEAADAQNPGRTGVRGGNPCNPGTVAAVANPCNPGAVVNPCNPGTAGRVANPCDPDGGSRASFEPWKQTGAELEWAKGYRGFTRVTDYVLSEPHGNRMVVTYITPQAAARVYQHNARLVAQQATNGFQDYPEGTIVAQSSFAQAESSGDEQKETAATTSAILRDPKGKRGKTGNSGTLAASDLAALQAPEALGLQPGPLFFMKKEAPGYDLTGGDWRYAATDRELRLTIGDGATGGTGFCKECHAQAVNRSHLFAKAP